MRVTRNPRTQAMRIPAWALLALLAATPWPAGLRGPGGRAEAVMKQEAQDVYGIGVMLKADGDYPVVTNLATGGAAKKDGRLKRGDHVTGVAEGDAEFVDCKGLDAHQVIDLSRGANGSIVRLRVMPAGSNDPAQTEVIALARAELYLTRLSPGDEEQLEKLMTKVTPALEAEMAKEMDNRERKLEEATGLGADGLDALKKADHAAVDQWVRRAAGRVKDYLEGACRRLRRKNGAWRLSNMRPR